MDGYNRGSHASSRIHGTRCSACKAHQFPEIQPVKRSPHILQGTYTKIPVGWFTFLERKLFLCDYRLGFNWDSQKIHWRTANRWAQKGIHKIRKIQKAKKLSDSSPTWRKGFSRRNIISFIEHPPTKKHIFTITEKEPFNSNLYC